MTKDKEIEINTATLTTGTSLDAIANLIDYTDTLTRADDLLTPISSSNFISSISLSAIQEIPTISLSSKQDSGDITAGELFGQFHVIYEASSFYESQSLRTAKLKPLIEKALKQGIDINTQGLFQYTSLHKAIYHGLYDVAEFLLEKGANPNIKNDAGNTPLHMIAECK